MNGERFDVLTKMLDSSTGSRRQMLRVAATCALGAALARFSTPVDGAEAATCRQVGEGCRRAGQCCSGVCKGPDGKQTCRAHDAGTCEGALIICTRATPCNGRDDCFCRVITGGARFCSAASRVAVCQRDGDCVAQGFPLGSACLPLDGPVCPTGCAGGVCTACAVPCGAALPPP